MAIDEKKLIEYLETLAEFERKKSQESAEIGAFDMATCYGHGEYCYKNAINAAEEQPKIGGWIPCSERFPEVEQTVLLSLRSLDVSVGFRANTDGYFYTEGEGYVLIENVLAWQPLPEEYHG